jgi:hypothetical protein
MVVTNNVRSFISNSPFPFSSFELPGQGSPRAAIQQRAAQNGTVRNANEFMQMSGQEACREKITDP